MSKALISQAGGLSLTPGTHTKMQGAAVGACSLSPERLRQEDSWGLSVNQVSLISELQAKASR